MKSPYYFIIRPLGDEYNNEVEISGQKIIVNSTVENHKHVNRLAEVVYAPSRSRRVKSGDIIVVHHNIFRIYYDIKGRAKKSPNYFKDGMYFIDEYQFYLYNDGKEWKSVGDYCFVQPIEKENAYLYEEGTELNTGFVVYDNDCLNDLGVKSGDKVNFTKNSEYEFTINDTVLYRMRTNDICALL